MADIHDLFKKFNNEISLSTDKQNNLRKGRDALRSKIKTWFTDHDKQQPTFCWQGSFAMKTTVNTRFQDRSSQMVKIFKKKNSVANQHIFPTVLLI